MGIRKFFDDIISLQDQYKDLVKSKRLTKKSLCELCIPFRDEYSLTDLQVLKIARNEVDLKGLLEIADKINL